MNTISSVYYGWAFLIVAGGGSYYFAKRSINADRAQRQAFENERRAKLSRQLQEYDDEAHENAARAPGGRDAGKSRFEASEPYRARKGDRFS